MPSGNVPIAQRQAGVYFAFNFEQVTVAATAIGFTVAEYQSGDKKAQIAFLTVETADIRYTYDGTTPTSTIGHLLTDGSSLTLKGAHDIENFRAIRTGAVSAVLSCTFEG